MLASHTWLKELSGLPLEPADVAKRLTTAGIEVEAMHAHGVGLDGVVVAEVRALRPHPKRDKLRLVTVRYASGEGGEQEVVCGAPNVPEPGGLVALARLGAMLPGGLEIAERELGGVTSQGMLCSEEELGIGAGDGGILILDAGVGETRHALGTCLAHALSLRDTEYELSLTPNRPDCLRHVGLARDLCASNGKPFTVPEPRLAPRLSAAQPGLLPPRASVRARCWPRTRRSAPRSRSCASSRAATRARRPPRRGWPRRCASR
jgi:phenylalanyl-tRNA synthetase beta chain